MSTNPLKYHALGGLGVAAGIATLGSARGKNKKGGGMPGSNYLDTNLEKDNNTHYIDEQDVTAIRFYPVRFSDSAARMAA